MDSLFNIIMRIFNISLTIILIIMIYGLVFGQNGLVDKSEINTTLLQEIAKENSLLQESKDIETKVINLKNNPNIFAESYIRRSLIMIKPDEVFFRFIK